MSDALQARIEPMEQRTLMSAGAVDPTFGVDGQTTIAGVTLPGAYTVDNIALDSQGRTLVAVSYIAGRSQTVKMWRLNTNGSVDNSFNASAALLNIKTVGQILPESNGDILLIGGLGVERLTSTGALDKTFSSAATGGTGLLLPGGKFMVIDGVNNFVFRYNADGSPDTTFGSNGEDDLYVANENVAVQDIKLDSSGRVLLSVGLDLANGDTAFGVARLLANGQFDPSFGTAGISVDVSNAAQPGTFGPASSRIFVTSGGLIDQLGTFDFHNTGVRQDLTAYSSDGKQVGGAAYVDQSQNGQRYYYFNGMAVQSDGKVIAVGNTYDSNTDPGTAFVARFNGLSISAPGLAFDPTFDGSGQLNGIASAANGTTVLVDSQGRVEVASPSGPITIDLTISRILTAGSSADPAVALTGTIIGTTGSYQNKGNTAAKAFDGNLSTFFDAPGANGNWVGLDLGTLRYVTQISFAPRAGFTSRMVGGIFQGANTADFSSGVVNLYTVTTTPAAGSLTTVGTGVAGPFRYVRYLSPAGSYGNIAEAQFAGAEEEIFTGNVIGTPGTYQSSGNFGTNAFDGNLSTYFDAPTASGEWVGTDMGSAVDITKVKYAPRAGFTSRMIGGKIQASNTADFSSGVVTAYTITTAPPTGVLTTVTFASIGAYQYWRYIGPTGGYCNISELEFSGI
jgi:uncharacterized delta-60 repeat protein